MKKITSITLILFISLLSSPSWSDEILPMDLLYKDRDLYYDKFNGFTVPFTGQVTGKGNGHIKDGKREGSWSFNYENGQLWGKGKYKDGKREGFWEGYHNNGQLSFSGNYKNGKLDGTIKWYYRNGELDRLENYQNGKRDGIWKYFNRDGSLIKKEIYKESVISSLSWNETVTLEDLDERDHIYYKKFTNIPFTGLLLYYNIYGALTGKTTFKNGKKDGLSENYNMVVYSSEEDGTLWEKDHKYWKDGLSVKGNYKDGKKDGLWEHYYFYGELREKYYYKDGKKEGVSEFYNENGQLDRKGNHNKYGNWDGPWEFYHDNGQLNRKGIYKNGKKDGLWEYFNADGSLKKTETFRDGELVE